MENGLPTIFAQAHDQGEQNVNNEPARIIKSGPASCTWIALILIIVIVAVIGILGGHEQTATALLVFTATFSGLVAMIATLKSEKNTSTILAVTAALSAAVGLLVNYADTIPGIFTKLDRETAIVVVAVIAIVGLTIAVCWWNRENGESTSQPEGSSHGPVPNEESEV